MWLAISVPWSPVNKFTILTIEDPNTIDSELVDAQPLNLLVAVTPLENFLRKCNMGYTLYPWISLLESTLETSYKPQT